MWGYLRHTIYGGNVAFVWRIYTICSRVMEDERRGRKAGKGLERAWKEPGKASGDMGAEYGNDECGIIFGQI